MITSINNEKIKAFLSLKDKKIRNEEQKFLIEGLHLVEEASKTSLLETIITSDENLLKKFNNVTSFHVTDAIIKKLSSTTNPQPIVGIVKMPSYDKYLNKLVEKEDLKLVLLDEINDPGNLGTIIRTTAALGYDAIIMSPNCVDLYNEKVVRATQGVLFKIPLLKEDLLNVIKVLKKHHIKCLGTALSKDATSIKQVKLANRFAICFGNEARGIAKPVLASMDEIIKLEMKNDVESLNVAIAAAITMYELIR